MLATTSPGPGMEWSILGMCLQPQYTFLSSQRMTQEYTLSLLQIFLVLL